MIQLTDTIWIGDSADEEYGDLDGFALLNVAQDLQGTHGWSDGIECMQVGLVDGPGNPLTAYHAAVLALAALLRRSKVLVFDHTGGRALAVVIMYLSAIAGRGWPGDWTATWDGWLSMLHSKIEGKLPAIHEAHCVVFNKINWKLLSSAIEG